jgi:hypothetical protein
MLQKQYEYMLASLNTQPPNVKNVVMALKNIEQDMLAYLRNLFMKKRQPAATHVLLFLVSDERRNKKPFAMPVQYIPYHSIRDQFVRDMTNNIKRGMMKMELKPVGKT